MSLGVPPLLAQASQIISTASLVVADAKIAWSLLTGGVRWGIYNAKGTQLVLQVDSINSVEYRQNSIIAQYPVEQGSFGSYNKIATPYSLRVRAVKSGSDADLTLFLARCELLAASLDLYQILTPSRRYNNANIERIDYRRTASSGVSLLTVDISFIEIRQVNVTRYTQTAQPSGADPAQGGNIQAQPATGAVTQVVAT